LWSAYTPPATDRPELDPAETLAALQAVEAELTALGGYYGPNLADAIGLVSGVFSRRPADSAPDRPRARQIAEAGLSRPDETQWSLPRV
jgi:hypothetical protein